MKLFLAESVQVKEVEQVSEVEQIVLIRHKKTDAGCRHRIFGDWLGLCLGEQHYTIMGGLLIQQRSGLVR